MSELEQSQANNQTQKYPVTHQRTCPVCGASVVATMRAGQWMLDYHHDQRIAYKKWCGGSDMNISEAQ